MMVRFDGTAQAGHSSAMTEPHDSAPRQAASAALFRGTDILLIRRAYAPWAGHWSLPGGRLEAGETPDACVRREVMEELGLTVADPCPVVTQNLPGFRLSVFAARLPEEATPVPNGEIADWCWHAQDDALPEPHTHGLADVLAKARAALG